MFNEPRTAHMMMKTKRGEGPRVTDDIRRAQMVALAAILPDRPRPAILLAGDFNNK